MPTVKVRGRACGSADLLLTGNVCVGYEQGYDNGFDNGEDFGGDF